MVICFKEFLKMTEFYAENYWNQVLTERKVNHLWRQLLAKASSSVAMNAIGLCYIMA